MKVDQKAELLALWTESSNILRALAAMKEDMLDLREQRLKNPPQARTLNVVLALIARAELVMARTPVSLSQMKRELTQHGSENLFAGWKGEPVNTAAHDRLQQLLDKKKRGQP